MQKLFIIGNGFDIFHHIPTTYGELREYFRRPLDYKDWLGIDPTVYYDNPIYLMDQMIMESVFNFNKVEGKSIVFVDHNKSSFSQRFLLKRLKGKGVTILNKSFLWREFEETLGRVDFSQFIQDDAYYDTDDMIRRAFDCLQSAFNEWIASVDISNIIADKNVIELFNAGDAIFLTFNYTTTLEDTYHIPSEKICHIHGKSGGKLIFGHSGLNEDEFLSLNKDFPFLAKKIFIEYTKNDKKIIEQNIKFFNEINGCISDIYVFGFSFSSCDIRYIAEICRRASTANWHFNDFESKSFDFEAKFSLISPHNSSYRPCPNGLKIRLFTFFLISLYKPDFCALKPSATFFLQ